MSFFRDTSLAEHLKHRPAFRVVVLTGAGISAESGIKTFRDNNGLWENHPVETVATPEGFALNPTLVHRFYNQRRQQLLSAEVLPNNAHMALAKLEKALGERFTLITQNVDNLHERAGNQNVIHMHGELLKAKCSISNQRFIVHDDLTSQQTCSCCKKTGTLRPDIVWFGEVPYHMAKIENMLMQCDLFISIGTSGNVYPAAGFVQAAKAVGAYSIEINLAPSQTQTAFDEHHYGPATQVLDDFVNKLLEVNT
jgi:NAD-dependent deacetylase